MTLVRKDCPTGPAPTCNVISSDGAEIHETASKSDEVSDCEVPAATPLPEEESQEPQKPQEHLEVDSGCPDSAENSDAAAESKADVIADYRANKMRLIEEIGRARQAVREATMRLKELQKMARQQAIQFRQELIARKCKAKHKGHPKCVRGKPKEPTPEENIKA